MDTKFVQFLVSFLVALLLVFKSDSENERDVLQKKVEWLKLKQLYINTINPLFCFTFVSYFEAKVKVKGIFSMEKNQTTFHITLASVLLFFESVLMSRVWVHYLRLREQDAHPWATFFFANE